ncbi:putative lipoprotein [Fimbriiglobus ruber]|uniref:Putative lipoprotein n=1 Tax=Fimbriiglobus ruber TaxID=1908690 RepID=A0A225D1Z2_9BACT|nr:putative lipoprotein [Fimbriiglobus ruber]
MRDVAAIPDPPQAHDSLVKKLSRQGELKKQARESERQKAADLSAQYTRAGEKAGLVGRLLFDRGAAAVAAAPEPKRYKLLALSGGGMFGAYSAGVVCGWSDAGTRPTFDVVTGISAGTLVGLAVYAGPEYNDQLRHLLTSVYNEDIYKIFPGVLGRVLARGGVASSEPLDRQLQQVMTPDYFEAVARAHEAGRRFYVGTTNVDTRRFVIWDMGAIAVKRTPEARTLYRKVALASASFPGFLTPVPITVDIDGKPYTEFHVDGGTARAVFFHPPPGADGAPIFGEDKLPDTDLYVVVAGKIYGDPVGTPPQAWSVGFRAVSTLLDSGTRSELFRMFSYSKYAGMNFHMNALRPDYEVPAQSMTFDPVVMSGLFLEGYNRARCEPAETLWDSEPPETDPRASLVTRQGTCLTAAPLAPAPLPTATETPNASPPVTPRPVGPRPSPRLPSSLIP